MSLQHEFLQTKGKPVQIGADKIVQCDYIALPGPSVVEIVFLGETPFIDNGLVLRVEKPGSIRLSDETDVTAVQIWDELGLPRVVSHVVKPNGKLLMVYNKYRIKHSENFITEDNFTGNAGMVVTELTSNKRLYECSNGVGQFSKTDLIFELSWKPFTN